LSIARYFSESGTANQKRFAKKVRNAAAPTEQSPEHLDKGNRENAIDIAGCNSLNFAN
jgi:hypothetical protein